MTDKHDGLYAEGVSKHFSGVQALSSVSVGFAPGSVTAVLGENGAGKSTLLRIIGGDYAPDAGHLEMAGVGLRFRSPRDAHRAGVRVIGQEPEIVPHVTVAENVYLGALPRRSRMLDRRALNDRVRADLSKWGFEHAISPTTQGRDLSPAQRQLVEILRALTSNAKVLAFDEPTSSLSEQEVVALFRLIRELRQQGLAVIYVSHRLKEVFEIADDVVVLRDGHLVATRSVAATTEAEIVRLMVGRDLSTMFTRQRNTIGKPLLEVHGLTNEDVRDVSLTVHAGEVVALAGLVGAGRSELVRAIVGDRPLRSGSVTVDGRRLRLRQPRDVIRAGVGYAPEERKSEALFLDRTVSDNLSIAVLDRLRLFRFVRRAAEKRLVDKYVERLSVRTPSTSHVIRKLSGGNQQKVVLARWLARAPQVLILDEPTRGIDVGAKAEIYRIIADLANAGIAILVISSELPEVIGLADRIIVMQNGHITGELSQAEATEEAVLSLAMADTSRVMTGGNQ
ncbi:MAG TPA: sugar ABC transporter ATP-binding protein [Acidothermaceae bacterium]